MALALSTKANLAPTKEMAAQTRWVVNTINSRHYLRDTIEKLDGAEMVEAYISSFDYGRMYFTQPEIKEFEFRFAGAMESFLEKGNLYAAFEIYKQFEENAKARTIWVYEQLARDFTFDEVSTFTPDRREAEWAADDDAADALWLRRLKYELLNEMLSLAAEKTAETATDTSDDALPTTVNVNAATEAPTAVDADEDETPFDPAMLRRLLTDESFYAEILEESKEKIERRYERNLSYTLQREPAEVQEAFINSMTKLFDPHSNFFSADTLENFNSSVQNSFVGIGALLEDDDGICTIKEVLPGGPAERSRLLEAEDQILGVAQGNGEFEDVVDMQLRYIVRKIKGEKGSIVRLLIRPGDASDPSVREIIPLKRDEVKLTANLASGKLITVPDDDGSMTKVGVIELPSFYGNIGTGNTLSTTSKDVAELINKLRDLGAEGLILDLRMNGGGLLPEAVRVAGLFIPVGPVVQVRDSGGRKEVLSDRDPTMLWEGPLIVLTSRFSASASEIVAGALQDHERALIVGNSSTHGKGTVQEVYHMNNRVPFAFLRSKSSQTRPVASKITIKQFYLPDGSSTQVKGVPSDIVLPSVNEYLPIGEDDLPHALPWRKIEEVPWINNWAKLDVDSAENPSLVMQLRDASTARMANLPEFQFLNDQIAWRKKRIDEKSISINLAERIDNKITEKAYIDQLDATYEMLSENDYVIEPVELRVTEEQNRQSLQLLSEPIEQIVDDIDASIVGDDVAGTIEAAVENAVAANQEDDEEEAVFDIHLRESARIMADWVEATI